MPRDAKMVAILTQLGAQRKATQEPPPEGEKKLNRFGTGGATGGPDLPVEVGRVRVQLNTLLSRWKGEYATAVEAFYFPLFTDGSLIRYTETMKILGAQEAKRKRDWVEVKIGVPESWWREEEPAYKRLLTDSIEKGLHSMIALLQRNKHEVRAELLLRDWEGVKKEFLSTPAPPYAAERQQAAMMSLVKEVIRAAEERKQLRQDVGND
jgi:hypothetical protein